MLSFQWITLYLLKRCFLFLSSLVCSDGEHLLLVIKNKTKWNVLKCVNFFSGATLFSSQIWQPYCFDMMIIPFHFFFQNNKFHFRSIDVVKVNVSWYYLIYIYFFLYVKRNNFVTTSIFFFVCKSDVVK